MKMYGKDLTIYNYDLVCQRFVYLSIIIQAKPQFPKFLKVLKDTRRKF